MFLTFFVYFSLSLKGNTYGYSTKKIPKYNEDLDRGVVVINTKSQEAFISWRFLITDDDNIGFNVYREDISNQTIEKLNNETISKVTYFRDTTRNQTKEYNYFIGSVISSKEVENSTKYTLKSDTPIIPCYRVPIHKGCRIKTVWPGDLNGDGKFDFVIGRMCEAEQKIEAYLSNGTFLWQIDLGSGSLDHDIFRPSATTINNGHFDGVNVYDLDGDGKSEVFIRIANNVTFGDGTVLVNDEHNESYKYYDSEQWIGCIDGVKGTLKAKAPIPSKYIEHGPMPARFGIGYLDGIRPSLVSVMINRDWRRDFHMMIASYSFNDDNEFVMNWNWLREESGLRCDEGHHTRIADVDFDGKDEIHEIGFTLNGDGTLRYTLSKQQIYHGDRFYVGKYNKDDKVMMGYGIQQDNPTNLTEYYYDASSGDVIWKHFLDQCVDVGRGNVGDFDPRYPGYEVYSFYGMYNAKANMTVANDTSSLFPSNNIYWDGTLVPSCYHKSTINKWNCETGKADRVLTAYKVYYDVYGEYPTTDETYPLFHGDIIGDWREEFILSTPDYDQLIIYTTNMDTDIRLTALSQDPGMRSSMSLNGYKQSHMSLMYMATDMDIKSERNFLKSYLAKRASKSYVDDQSGKKKNGLGAGAIVGIVVAVLVVVAAVIVGVIFYLRRKRNDDSSLLFKSVSNN